MVMISFIATHTTQHLVVNCLMYIYPVHFPINLAVVCVRIHFLLATAFSILYHYIKES